MLLEDLGRGKAQTLALLAQSDLGSVRLILRTIRTRLEST